MCINAGHLIQHTPLDSKYHTLGLTATLWWRWLVFCAINFANAFHSLEFVLSSGFHSLCTPTRNECSAQLFIYCWLSMAFVELSNNLIVLFLQFQASSVKKGVSLPTEEMTLLKDYQQFIWEWNLKTIQQLWGCFTPVTSFLPLMHWETSAC